MIAKKMYLRYQSFDNPVVAISRVPRRFLPGDDFVIRFCDGITYHTDLWTEFDRYELASVQAGERVYVKVDTATRRVMKVQLVLTGVTGDLQESKSGFAGWSDNPGGMWL